MSLFIRALEARDFHAIIKIADRQLGDNYLNNILLNKYMCHQDCAAMVAEHSGKVVGFSLVRFCSHSQIAQLTGLPEDMLTAILPQTEPIGYRKITAVMREENGKGIGSLLVERSNQLLRQRAKNIITIAWKSNKGIHIEKLMQRQGLQPVKELPQFWYQESLKEQYKCQSCGHPPCNCTAVVFAG